MNKLIVNGGNPLHGEVHIQGAKNAAQKILPATVLFPGEYVIRNIPLIEDSVALIDILRFLGAEVEFLQNHTVRVNTEKVVTQEIPPDVTAKSTGSFLFAGALLGRFGEVKIWHPGGDRIGNRPITWHLDAFRKLGASVIEDQSYYKAQGTALAGCTIPFARRTVNGTVNAILASARAVGVTLLQNVALEPEIDNFTNFMQKAGAKVERIESDQIRVEGVGSGRGYAEIDIIPDRNDAATFAIASALCRGSVTLRGVIHSHLSPLLTILDQVGAKTKLFSQDAQQSLTIQCDKLLQPDLYITSRPYPGFSTDWGPMMQVLLTQISNTSVFHETIFPQRFAHINELIKMGAQIEYFNPVVDDRVYNFIREPNDPLFHAIKTIGPTRLRGQTVTANDVRAGAALTLAGLIADGNTEISGVEQINRGYEDFAGRLMRIGAEIHEVSS